MERVEGCVVKGKNRIEKRKRKRTRKKPPSVRYKQIRDLLGSKGKYDKKIWLNLKINFESHTVTKNKKINKQKSVNKSINKQKIKMM